ncbi:MAG: SRPBCC family protein [Gordonia sp. (in: high G+C Gram-positive bacteria)]|uniref:SRPBCC family protein n=1 Tax=Gordonia sp. (in: high G+C Gram-positive bacteria) TaxID=84139 RepID=UPI0039E40C02
MWTTDYRASTNASPDAVWAALEALHSGTRLGPESDDFVLHGPFATGTTLTVTPQGQEPMTSTIVELDPGHTYADRTEFGGLTLTFRHRLTPLEDGGTTVTHVLEIDGPDADTMGPELGPQISDDFPTAMAELFAAAERGVTAGRLRSICAGMAA